MTPRDLQTFFDAHAQRNWVKHYFSFDVATFERLLHHRDETFWNTLGARRALKLFHDAAVRVPAYKDFLRTNRIRHATVKTIADFARVPRTTKENYINRYALSDRCWDGILSATSIIAMSSGTSGEPKFWPRGGFSEFEAAIIHELTYRSLFSIHKKRTLLVIGFPMGVYVSGIATLLPSWMVAQRDYDLTIVAAGNNKVDMQRITQHLRTAFDQVVLIGHPFFIKDVLETGAAEGVDWSTITTSLLFCSEGFNEQWRDHVASVAGSTPDSVRIFNTYGSSETLLIGHETPVSIALRKTMNDTLTPNIFQYNPFLRYLDVTDGILNFTLNSGVPLIKYDLADGGTILPFSEATQHLSPSLRRSAWKLPFVTLDGRRDNTIIFYAANIYPEHIHAALNDKKFLRSITGKFAMRKEYLKNKDEFLEIHVELRPRQKVTAALATAIAKHATSRLLDINMEYKFLWSNLDKDIRPRVILHPYQCEPYFRAGLKPRYIIK